MMKFGFREREDNLLKKYNKLVRDKIPKIIDNEGRKAVYHKLTDDEYLAELEKKLDEEVREYQEDKNLEEIADIVEVLFAICEARGYSIGDLNKKREEKALECGSFADKIFLEYVE